MTSSYEITKKLIEAEKVGEGSFDIATGYIQELLIDMGTRYGMTTISQPLVAAAVKLYFDGIYSHLDAHGKSLCDAFVALSDGNVQEIRFSFRFKKEDGE